MASMASMASLQAQLEAVRSAVASTSTCTPTISATLKDLLQTKEADQDGSSKTNAKTRPTKATATTTTSTRERSTTVTKRGGGKGTTGTGEKNGLDRNIGAKEKATLATQVINATLKALGDAVKSAPSQASKPALNPDPVKSAAHNRTKLRRSNSVPMTPLQPRSLNRVSTSPVATRPRRSTSLVSASTGCLATIECARAAFFCLRSLQASGEVALPELQLESGMSSFVSKLVGLHLFEQATKELRILKRRLENMVPQPGGKKSKSTSASEQSSAAKTFSDLLDFPHISAPSPLLGLIITAQLQALRILHGLKKLSHLDTALPYLRQSNASSPANLLLLSQQGAKPDRAKCANQLESLSKILLSLSPSIAPKDDATAMEPRLSPSPEAALEVQALGLTARLQSWRMSGHKGDVDKDILGPLSKCLGAFVRRNRSEPDATFQTVSNAFHQVWERIEEMGLRPVKSSNAPLAAIYQLLATMSRDASDINRAKKWLMQLKDLMDPQHDSVAKRYAVSAQLLALALKQSPLVDDSLVVEVLDALQGPLSGQVTELDDLLISLCLVRKAAIHLVISSRDKESEPGSASTSFLNLRKFIFQLPRFTLKWLGPPPQTTGSTKEFLRFEQRRQLLSKYLHQILDSALMLINKSLDEDSIAWDHMDPILQDCLALLENIGITFQAVKSDPSSSYYVKISHLYYRQHISLRKSKTTEPTSLRALRRSISAIKQRPDNEQSRALLLVKWEKLAEFCRSFGRRDEAADALRSIRDHLVQQELVSTITSKLATQPLLKVWQQTPDADALSRAACSLAKIDRKPTEWTWLLDGSDKATALEHDLYFIISPDSTFRQEVRLTHPTVVSLLHHYSLDQFPIRRLRSLLQLLNVNLDTGNETAHIREEAQTAADILKTTNLGNDSGLARYIPHLQSLAACMFSLVDASMDISSTNQALACWKTCVSKSQSADELSEHIDNPAQLQTTLQSLADFARVRGLEALSADILEVSTSISKIVATSSPDSLLSQSAALCIRHLNLGQSMKVERILEQSRELLSSPELSHESLVTYHLAAAEYHLAVGDVENADHHMVEARTAATSPSGQPVKRMSGSSRNISFANAFFLSSGLALERGDTPNALHFAKTAVKFLFCDWAKLEEMRRAATSNDVSMADVSQGETSGLDSSLNNSQIFKSEAALASAGPTFWAIVYPLFRCLLRLSSIYAHTGMYQETLYYAEQAKKVAQSTESLAYRFQSETWLALVWLMAGQSEKALEIATELKSLIPGLEPTCAVVTALCELSRVYRDTEDGVVESALMDRADAMVKAMNSNGAVTEIEGEHQLESKMAKLSIKQVSATKATVRLTKTTRTTTRATGIPTSKRVTATKKTKAPVQPLPPIQVVEDVQISFLRATVLQCQSMDLLSKKDWTAAIENLQAAYELSKLSTDLSQERMLMATGLIGQSLDQMGHDSVYSVIQESTLSFPSVAASLKDKSEKSALVKSPPTRKGRGAVQDSQTFTEHLRQAQEYLLEAHSIASLNGDGGLVHRVANLLQNVSILLSTTTSSRATGTGHPAHATCSIELARNLIWRRERKTLRLDTSGSKGTKPEWPMPVHHNNHDNRRSSLGFSIDMNKFQRDYVDIIPKSWNVVSVSMSDSQHDLCITKLQAGHSPFAIRLPLDRATSRDADSEMFPFHEGRAELLDIIKLANRTCHDARDMNQKDAKSVWWQEREALDERLRDLLINIEQMWLGGFKGIFTQHHRRSELLARFQKSFLNMLDKHLPSRQQVRSRRTKAAGAAPAPPPPTKISLDPRIMDLFIGLGDATAPDCDLEEPLTDLLYFVVDILQFHGERNAYDEVDFDSMVVETFDALHAYHAAANSGRAADLDEGSQDGVHTILILDNALHAFPWESMPCMQGRSVSRVPSLAYLRRAILEQQPPPPPPSHQSSTASSSSASASSSSEGEDEEEDELSKSTTTTNSSSSSSSSSRHQPRPREGHYASIHSGTYILNPSGDLTTTAATFGGPLATSLPPAWRSIEGRAPTETEFEAALKDRDLLLYFGHGSGAQYIRARTVRQLAPRCRAAALLMGCSSAALEYVGDAAFAAYGTARHYMLAGCPAVVGTLWDVTDRDIDRFAARLFEEWGLVRRGTFASERKRGGGSERGRSMEKGKSKGRGKGKGRKKATDEEEEEEEEGEGEGLGQTSLVEAVARSRDACRLRYLTAAAVCVYGIPVYISK